MFAAVVKRKNKRKKGRRAKANETDQRSKQGNAESKKI